MEMIQSVCGTTTAIPGCTDPLACNYDATANTDDGSCDLPNGCGDALYLEYDASVTCSDASACLTLIVTGCTDLLASNYDANANTDDGSCTYPTDCNGIENGIAAADDCGTCHSSYMYDMISHTMTPVATYADTVGIGGMFVLAGSAIDIASNPMWNAACTGCTDPSAFNFDPNASIDDGSCVPVLSGCTDPAAFNYDSNANTDDGSCIAVVMGCMDPLACNYDATANTDDGSCDLPNGCGDALYLEYDASVTCSDASACLTLIVTGCTDPLASNYDANANTDDGSCIISSSPTSLISDCGDFVSGLVLGLMFL